MQEVAKIADELLEGNGQTEPRLLVHVSADQRSWHSVLFEGESPKYVDRQASAYLRANPHLSAEIDQESTCWSLFPRTFNAVLAPALAQQPLPA